MPTTRRRQRGRDRLIHVEIAVLGETADKRHVGLACGQMAVELGACMTLYARNGIERFPFPGLIFRGKLAHEIRAVTGFARDVF